jgi:stage II sporulation protein M
MFSLVKDPLFVKYVKQYTIIFGIAIICGVIVGLYLPHILISSTVHYAASDSISAHIVNARNDSLYKMVAFFINNMICASLFAIIIPLLYCYRVESKILNLKYLTFLSKFGFASQTFVIGMIIGFMIPLINNNLIVITSLLPHGIIEIPAFIMSAAIGVWFMTEKDIMPYKDLVKLFFINIAPMIFIAAIIEAYITPALMIIVS